MSKNFFRCSNCLFPNTKPELHFDEKGVCMACKFTPYYQSINWDKKKQEFYDLLEETKKSVKQSDNNYDCTIAVSGGKDSTYQTYLITKEVGLKPLLLSFEPSYPTEVGKENLKNLVNTYGCDLIQLKKSPTYKKLARIGFKVVGDHEWPNHVGIFCWPMQMANKFNIPLTFYGEPIGLIGIGRWEVYVRKNAEELTRSDIDQYVGFNGYRISDMMEFDKTISKKDVIPYTYPEKNEMNVEVRAIQLGHFFKWDKLSNIEKIKKMGWKSLGEKFEGTFTDYEDIDCGFMPIHQYFKFIKYGYGRATDHVAYEIRWGRMNKKQGKELIIEYENKLPLKYFEEFLNFLKISEDEFFETRERFTNPLLFEKNHNNKFKSKNDKNYFLNQNWLDSFD